MQTGGAAVMYQHITAMEQSAASMERLTADPEVVAFLATAGSAVRALLQPDLSQAQARHLRCAYTHDDADAYEFL